MAANVGARIRQLRFEKHWTQDDIAEKVGVTREAVSYWELNRRTPAIGTLEKIAQVLGVSVAELLEEPALAGKAKAPGEAGRTERPEDEEQPRVIPQSADSLKQHIAEMKALKELREAEMEDIDSGAGPVRVLVLQMQLADKGLRDLIQELGVLDFAEAVTMGREMAQPRSIPLCHELLRHLRDLEALTDEAAALHGAVSADIRVEEVKGPSQIEAFLHGSGPDRLDTES